MALSSEEIKKLILQSIPDATITIRDMTGDGSHYSVEIISKSFADLSRVKQHKMVYDSLNDSMKCGLHALSIVTKI